MIAEIVRGCPILSIGSIWWKDWSEIYSRSRLFGRPATHSARPTCLIKSQFRSSTTHCWSLKTNAKSPDEGRLSLSTVVSQDKQARPSNGYGFAPGPNPMSRIITRWSNGNHASMFDCLTVWLFDCLTVWLSTFSFFSCFFSKLRGPSWSSAVQVVNCLLLHQPSKLWSCSNECRRLGKG